MSEILLCYTKIPQLFFLKIISAEHQTQLPLKSVATVHLLCMRAAMKQEEAGESGNDRMTEAILAATGGGISVREAARIYGVPRSTLQRKLAAHEANNTFTTPTNAAAQTALAASSGRKRSAASMMNNSDNSNSSQPSSPPRKGTYFEAESSQQVHVSLTAR